MDITCRDNASISLESAIDLHRRSTLGERMIAQTKRRLGRECMIVLLGTPKANEHYPNTGFEHTPRAWMMKGGK